jgi:urea transporter
MLVGAAMAFFGAFGNGAWNPVWAIAAIILSALTAVVMETVGTWFATRFRVAPLGIPFNGVMLTFLLLLAFVPQPFFDLGPPPPPFPAGAIDGFRLIQSLPMGLAQIFFSDKLVSVLLVVLGVAISTPIGAVVGLLGCAMYLLAGLLLGAKPDELYTGLWGYNAALTATAIGGVFYTPNRLSISIGLICAFLASIASILLGSPVLAAQATRSVRAFFNCDDWVFSESCSDRYLPSYPWCCIQWRVQRNIDSGSV